MTCWPNQSLDYMHYLFVQLCTFFHLIHHPPNFRSRPSPSIETRRPNPVLVVFAKILNTTLKRLEIFKIYLFQLYLGKKFFHWCNRYGLWHKILGLVILDLKNGFNRIKFDPNRSIHRFEPNRRYGLVFKNTVLESCKSNWLSEWA